VVEDMPAMVCRFLPDGTLTFVNKEYCTYFNKSSDELINRNFFRIIPEREQQEIRKHYLSLGKEYPITTYEHQVITPDEKLRWQRWYSRALFNESGEITEYQSIGRDVTDDKKLEEELRNWSP
jgi:PAS domain S-box-containing protein